MARRSDRGLAPRRLSGTEVSTFSALSNGIDNGAEINVVGDIEFSEPITISGLTSVTIYSEVGAVFTSSFTASSGGMFWIDSGSDVTFTGLGFASGSASGDGGCMYVTGSTVEVEDSDFTSCYACVSGILSS